jgi:hypothetical protein
MSRIKKLEEFIAIDEMAKAWPVGAIVKCSIANRLGIKDRWSNWNKGGSTWNPKQAPKTEGGIFYMQIKNSGREWLEGKLLYTNCSTEDTFNSDIRLNVKSAEAPGTEFKILQKNDEKLKELTGKVFFMEGTEPNIMDVEGNKKTVDSAEYKITGYNFKLTDLYDQPVLFLTAKNDTEKYFCIKMSDIETLSKELSKEQREVIIDWYRSKLGADIVLQNDKFKITSWKIVSSPSREFPKQFTAGPFLTNKQAEEFIKELRKESRTLFNPASLEVSEDTWGGATMDVEALIKFSKAIGIDTSMKDLLALRKGAVIGKKFGL